MRPGIPSLRSAKLVREFERRLADASERETFRVVHYSLQSNHVHLVVEASGRAALARGMMAVGSRLARAVNRVFRRRGRVLVDRYHLRVLKTPREVRNVLRYVLLNVRRHASRLTGRVRLDSASSGRWFDGWSRAIDVGEGTTMALPVAIARSWLLTVGWRLHGLIEPGDIPGRG